MNDNTALLVQTTCHDLRLNVRSYVGRGTQGVSCIGVSCDDAHATLNCVIESLYRLGGFGVSVADALVADSALSVETLDGRKILYFPELPYTDLLKS